jgi:serine/threonine protein kinase
VTQGNVLISDWGEPFLADFGVTAVDYDNKMWKTKTKASASGTVFYMSPELLKGEQKKSTTASDVYAFAMTCYVR